MWHDKRLCELFGIEHPIIQAPMAGASTPEMAAAAANAGGVGSLGCAMMTVEAYSETFNKTRRQTNAALNMNFFCHEEPSFDADKNERAVALLTPHYTAHGLETEPLAEATNFPFGEEMAEAVLQTRPPIASFHFGLPKPEIVTALKEAGIKILSSATTVEEARDLEARGVDAIIAQGWEAGGHHGYYLKDTHAGIGTMALVPQIVDKVTVPVIAAGGISDGRGIAAALALGAAGVQIGTAFLTCQESGIPAIHKKTLLENAQDQTALTRSFSGRPARGVRNRYMTEMEPVEELLPEFPIMNTMTGPLRKASAEANSPDYVAMWSGQAVGLNKQTTTAELFETLVEETSSVLNMLGGRSA